MRDKKRDALESRGWPGGSRSWHVVVREGTRGGLTYSESCGRRPGVVSRSSPPAAGNAPRDPAAGSPCRSWPCNWLAPGSALSSRGRSPRSPRKRPAGPRSRDTAPERALSQVRAHGGPETSLHRVQRDSEEVLPLRFRQRGGTSGSPAEIAGGVPWAERPSMGAPRQQLPSSQEVNTSVGRFDRQVSAPWPVLCW